MKAFTNAPGTIAAAIMTLVLAGGLAQTKTNVHSTVKTLPDDKVTSVEKEIHFEISTSYGAMRGKLYNSTPKHRDNFIRLINEKYFDSLLFHRVISQFMIQGGDPESRGAEAGKPLGNGGPGYTIPAEIRNDLFHKKGALSAARQPDNVNPEKRSSGSQFYVVQGRVYSDQMLATQELRINQSRLNQAIRAFLGKPENKADLDAISWCQKEKQTDSINKIIARIKPFAMNGAEEFQFSEGQKQAYSKIGGTPHLDANYTVFGEIYDGLDIIDKIAGADTDGRDRPLSDVKMAIKIVGEVPKADH
jgi:cyclophilin family peptidyl-prolyl cis-trans isomerase